LLAASELLNGSIVSSYQVGRDNFQILNQKNFYAQGGLCQGIVEANLYYHIILSDVYGDLYEKYGHEDPLTIGFQLDDTELIRFCSELQTTLERDHSRISEWMDGQENKSQEEQWLTTLRNMNLTKQPQYILLAENEKSFTNGEETHAVIAYRSEGNKLYFMDPNKPANKNIYLEMNVDSFKMKNHEGYNYMFFIDANSLYNLDKLDQMFEQLRAGEYKKEIIPTYDLYEIIQDSSGNEVKVPLNTIQDVSKDEVVIQLETSSFKGHLTLYGRDGKEIAFYTRQQDNRVMIPLNDKSEQIGILIDHITPEGKLLVDFQWVTFNKSEMEQWHVAMQVIEIYATEDYSEATQKAMLENIQELYLYLQLLEDQQIALLKSGVDEEAFQLNYDGRKMEGVIEVVDDGIRHYESFMIEFENEDYGSGYLLVGDDKDGDALLFDTIWSRVKN